MQVIARCDLPTGSRGHARVASGTAGEIVHTPAYFSTLYSIRFDVHGKPLTLHGINRHEFRLLDPTGRPVEPGFPPFNRYPQPALGGPTAFDAATDAEEEDDDAESA